MGNTLVVGSNLVAVGTKSVLKIRAVESTFKQLGLDAEIVPTKTLSGIPDQPFGLEQMAKGALNRARGACAATGARVGIGIENGLVNIEYRWYDPPCVVVVADLSVSKSYGAFFPIPSWAIEEIEKDNTELGIVVQNLARGGEKDPHNYFSSGEVKREEILQQALFCALSEIRHPDRYAK